MNTQEWRWMIRQLRGRFPIQGNVVVIRRPIKWCCAWTTFNGKNFKICINSRQPKTGLIDSLIHEWAHVRAIDEAYGHRGRWAELHGEIYDTWAKDFAP